MFKNMNHIHAMATAVGTMGGFQRPPEILQVLGRNPLWNILMSSILIYQGGGALNFAYSVVMALVFFVLIHAVDYVYINFIQPSIPKEWVKSLE
jgi:hypothetical protein